MDVSVGLDTRFTDIQIISHVTDKMKNLLFTGFNVEFTSLGLKSPFIIILNVRLVLLILDLVTSKSNS